VDPRNSGRHRCDYEELQRGRRKGSARTDTRSLHAVKAYAISPELRQEPLVKDVSEQLAGIEKLVSFPEGKAPTAEDVRKLNEAVGKLMAKIESKESPK